MAATSGNTEEEVQVATKKIKRLLENWREIVLLMLDILIWRVIPQHPIMIFGASSIFFLIMYLLNLSAISAVSLITFCIVLCDYLGTAFIPRMYSPDLWNGSKEREFQKICYIMACYYVSFTKQLSEFYCLKHTKPSMYYAISLSLLFAFIWIGSVFSTIFLTYMTVTFVLLLPGLKRNGFTDQVIKQAKFYLAKILTALTSNSRRAAR